MKAKPRLVGKRVLFVCTGNSCRSQMAEGWCRRFYPNIEVFSAGLHAQGVNPFAHQVMLEAGIDISAQQSTALDEYLTQQFDLVVTVCDHAQSQCPTVFGGTVIHQRFDDPPKLAEAMDHAADKLNCYRQVRDQIKSWMMDLESHFPVPCY